MSDIYQRIKLRREELGLSQEALAKRMGYKSKSSINKIEMGINDIPQSKVLAFARALNTTTAYLMGDDDSREANPIPPGFEPIPQMQKIPLVGHIACGQPITAEENLEGYVEAPAEKRRALTEEEQHWIWDTPHRAQPAAIIMMLSGLRRGELSALTWADVDTINQTITINKTVEYPPDGKAYIRNMTKSAAGMRVVYIPRKLADYLDTLPRSNLLVYPSASGRMMTASAWKAVWQSYMAELNRKYGQRTPADLERMKKPGRHKLDMTIPPIILHWLRHTFCTLMYFAGVDAVQACAQMGHADVTTALKIYTHLDQQHKRRSMDKLDAYLSDDASQMQVKQK